jgi:arylsulfatase A-like enzyme
MEFIDRHSQEPFFIYLAYNAPHTPLQADSMYREMFKELSDEPNRIYAGMVSSIDDNIGKILSHLKQRDLDKNTLIAFTSDNGPARWSSYDRGWPEEWPLTLIGSAGELRGHKGQLFEGGHREPLILWWPDKIDSAQILNGLTSVMDLYPTILTASGISVPDTLDLDGVDLHPYISGNLETPPHDTLYWMTHNQVAMRAGKWKLIIGNDTLLFDIQTDLAERIDVSEDYPEITTQMINAWQEWSNPFPVSVSEKIKFTVQ